MLNLSELLQKSRPLSINNLEDIGDILQYLLPWAALLAVALQGDADAARRWLYAGSITVGLTLLGKFLFNFTPLGTCPNGGRTAFPAATPPARLWARHSCTFISDGPGQCFPICWRH